MVERRIFWQSYSDALWGIVTEGGGPLKDLARLLNAKLSGKLKNRLSLQKELWSRLSPVLKRVPGWPIGPALQNLVDKINVVGLRPQWAVHDGREKIISFKVDEGFKFSGKTREQIRQLPRTSRPNPVTKQRGIYHKKLTLRNQTFMVLENFIDAPSHRHYFFAIIVKALETGDFSLLRLCQQCSLVYVADDGRQRYCSVECRDAFHNSEAPKRVRAFRTRQAQKKEREKKTIRQNLQHAINARRPR